MLSFEIGPELQLIVDSARRFAQTRLRPAARAAERAGQVPPELCEEFSELGLGMLELPESLGGMEQGLLTAAIVAETLAQGDAALAMALPQPGPFARLVRLLGTPLQISTHLQAFTQRPASTWAGVALGGRAGSSCRAIRQGDSYLLQGGRHYILHGGLCDRLLVLAQLDDHVDLSGAAAFVVPVPSMGLTLGEREHTVGLEVLHGCSALLNDVRVPAAARLGEGDLTPHLDAFFACEGLLAAARSVGTARAAYEYALDYARDRHAFGKPVAHFQSVAFLLADMLMQCDAAQVSVYHAAWMFDHDPASALPTLYGARAQADEAAFFVTDNAVQILGGHGYIQDHPVEKWMRDVRMLALCHGSREAADSRAAASLLQGDAPTDLADYLPLGGIQPIWT